MCEPETGRVFWGLMAMDTTGNFNRDDAQSGVAAYEGGDDAPPSVGTDERRMHVRAYNHWVSLLNGRAYPSIEDLDPDNLDDFGPNSVLLDFTAGTENPVITFLGNGLRVECDLPVGVASVADIPSRSLLSRLTDHYLQIIANRAPIGFEAEYVNDRGNNTMYRGILMPFSSDDDTIDFIYGVINWKEVADDALTAGIVDEVERALAANPPRASEPVPVWADGPSAVEAAVVPYAEYAPVDDAEDDVLEFTPDGSEGLGDWLAAARDSAEAARSADARSRAALYRAVSLAWDFALAAKAHPQDYTELLAENRIAFQLRAPMTPVVKLVFGIGYDKTRLAEYALALSHAERLGLGRGELLSLLETHAGGLKGVVIAERAERRPAPKGVAASDDLQARARSMQPKGIVEIPGDEEFVILIARRVDPDHVAVLGATPPDDAAVRKALKALTKQA
jgi:hypothetical protein